MAPPRGELPDDEPTTPVRIEREALRQVHLLEGERIERVWRTGRGFLVMTNLRCVEVERKPQVFPSSDWEAGPSLFFYNLAPPKVELYRFLRLAEEREGQEGRSLVLRFILHDPHSVAEEIEAGRAAGREEWLRRRARAEAALRTSRERWEAGLGTSIRDGYRKLIRVRCGFCGNLIDVTASRCPFCGAPQTG